MGSHSLKYSISSFRIGSSNRGSREEYFLEVEQLLRCIPNLGDSTRRADHKAGYKADYITDHIRQHRSEPQTSAWCLPLNSNAASRERPVWSSGWTDSRKITLNKQKRFLCLAVHKCCSLCLHFEHSEWPKIKIFEFTLVLDGKLSRKQCRAC